MKHLFLIDGSGFLFRAYFGIKAQMTRPDGTPVNAVYGFTQMMLKLVEETDADHIAVIFDRARKTFRSDIYPEYKAHRPPPPDDLVPQFELVRQATRAMNIPAVDMDGFEADDLIATYARQGAEMGAEVTIVSTDKDLMQMVGGKIKMFDAMKNKSIGPAEVEEKFGVGPDKVIDIQALAGDSSDNVPGVQGIGIKTAAILINEYGDLDGVLENAGKIKQPKRREALIEQADLARISRDLVTLRQDVPVESNIEDFAVRKIEPDKLLIFLQEQGFKSLVTRIESQTGVTAAEPGPMEQTATADQKSGDANPSAVNSGAIKAAAVSETVYELVQDEAALHKWIAAACADGVLAVDTETTSLDSMEADLVGISLCTVPGHACYIPIAHAASEEQASLDLGETDDSKTKNNRTIKQISLKSVVKVLKPLLESPSVLKIGHNIKYDQKILHRYGIDVTPVDDTMILSYVLEGAKHGHGMDELSLLYLDHQTIKFKDVAGSGKSQVTFDKVPLDKALNYAAEDADITRRLFQVLKPRLVTNQLTTIYETLERPLIYVLRDMETAGIRVDSAFLKTLSADFARRLGDLEIAIHKLAGKEFNIGSPKQLGEVLFEEMGLTGGKKTKTGAYGTGADVLEGLAAEGHELPEQVLAWRQLAKLKSTYTDTLVDQINPETGRVHTNYGQAIASTGRLSSNDPNLQNIPIRTEEGRKIRQAFIPSEGHVLVSADYSQIELRLLAHVAGIDALKRAFHDGMDIHALTASQVFGVPVEGMDPMIRRQAKAINFGIIYGISAFGLARQLSISRGEASDYIQAYFEKYPGIRDFMEHAKETAREKGYVTTLYGRKCFVPGINDKNPNRRNFMERAAINAPIQGGAADIIKRAMIQLPRALKTSKLSAKMLLQVHDELIFDVPKKELEDTVEVVKNIMERAADLSVPIVVDTGHGKNWDEAH
ncbi:MAG: DNA polymerase I [Rhodospirillaceae bacterium]|nr:DNA polymerase I [Rhodospirillaceae bacterium]